MQVDPIVRIFFSKTGRAKYTSHLDTMRTLTRALKRSGLPLWYTQGFNPHLYMTFALPIALGYESSCESLDVRLTQEMDFDTIVKRVNGSFPPGFAAYNAAYPVMEPSAIAWADYDVRLIYEDMDVAEQMRRFGTFLNQPVIEVIKKTKKGEKEIDIRPLVQVLEAAQQEDAIVLRLRLASGNTVNINPTLFLKAFYTWANLLPDGVKIVRTAIYNDKMQIFE